MVYKEKIPAVKKKDLDASMPWKKLSGKKERKISIALSVDEIKKMFDAIPDSDVILCGFDPSRIHPRNLILTVFPVLPPCARPYVLADGVMCDDEFEKAVKISEYLADRFLQAELKRSKTKLNND